MSDWSFPLRYELPEKGRNGNISLPLNRVISKAYNASWISGCFWDREDQLLKSGSSLFRNGLPSRESTDIPQFSSSWKFGGSFWEESFFGDLDALEALGLPSRGYDPFASIMAYAGYSALLVPRISKSENISWIDPHSTCVDSVLKNLSRSAERSFRSGFYTLTCNRITYKDSESLDTVCLRFNSPRRPDSELAEAIPILSMAFAETLGLDNPLTMRTNAPEETFLALLSSKPQHPIFEQRDEVISLRSEISFSSIDFGNLEIGDDSEFKKTGNKPPKDKPLREPLGSWAQEVKKLDSIQIKKSSSALGKSSRIPGPRDGFYLYLNRYYRLGKSCKPVFSDFDMEDGGFWSKKTLTILDTPRWDLMRADSELTCQEDSAKEDWRYLDTRSGLLDFSRSYEAGGQMVSLHTSLDSQISDALLRRPFVSRNLRSQLERKGYAPVDDNLGNPFKLTTASQCYINDFSVAENIKVFTDEESKPLHIVKLSYLLGNSSLPIPVEELECANARFDELASSSLWISNQPVFPSFSGAVLSALAPRRYAEASAASHAAREAWRLLNDSKETDGPSGL